MKHPRQQPPLTFCLRAAHAPVFLIVLALAMLTAPLASAQTYMFNRADYSTGQGPQTLAIGDFNGDGMMDVVVGNTNSPAHTVSVLLGKPDGTFAANVDYAAGGQPASVAVGDFNGDGKLDIVVLYGFENAAVSVLLGNGDGTFKPFVTTTAGPAGGSIAVGDFNGDNILDVAIADNESPSLGVDVMLGNGNGTFKAPVSYATASDPRMVVVADFNGDKKLDLATVSSAGKAVSVLLGTGTGTFGTHQDFATSASGCISLAFGDLRHVGKIDMVAGCQSSGGVNVFLSNGDGTFKAAKNYNVPAGVDDVAVGDFNGDGKLDVAVTNDGTTGMVSILPGSGTGTLKTAVPFGTNFGPTALGAADFNGDGKLDLVTANSGSPFGFTTGTISVLLSNGKSLFAGRSDYKLTTVSTSGAYYGIAAGDLNGDGKVDLVLPLPNADQISVLLNKGNGTFKPFSTYSVSGPEAIALGDFNNDHKMDVAVMNFGGNGTISVLLNSGTGTFPTSTQYNIGEYGFGIAVGDFNKDGNLDIVATDEVNNTVSVLLGNGTGAFPSFVTYAVGNFPYGVTVGDFNGDGWPDLAVANQRDGTVSILLNKADGSGTFLAAKSYTVGGSPMSIAVGSFRGADKPQDLAVATNNAFGGIVTLPGKGDGTFGTAVSYDTLNNAYAVVAGDFNNDGILDLAVAIVNPGTWGFVTLMPGVGDGTFGNEVTLVTGTLPFGIVAADFNKDGSVDLATGNGTTFGDSGSATVLLNEPVVALAPTSIAFGSQKVGTTSAAQAVTVTNPGATPLKVSITISGDFHETDNCPAKLTVGANCTIDVTFSPTVTGNRTGTLTIKDGAPSSPQKLPLTGTGT
jgi:hypothetical protein